MAHRCNTKYWFNHAIQHGANGIEADITKGYNGKIYTWHGELISGYEDLNIYLDHACSELQSGNGTKVSMMIFDLKYNKRGNLKASDVTNIRRMVNDKLLKPLNLGRSDSDGGGFYVFYGVYEGDKYASEFEKSMANMPLKPWEGVNYDADLKTNPDVALKWKEKFNVKIFLYSSGIIAGMDWPTMWTQLKAAIKLRKSHAFGVYAWTFNRNNTAAQTISNIECDGVLGNMNNGFGKLPNELAGNGYHLVDRNTIPPFLKLRS